jgi:hypothetical protein
MSSRAASTASTVALGNYLNRVYVTNMKEAEQAYATHLQAAKELHQVQMHMMRSKRAIRKLNDELSKATAAAAAATELVDRKRKAAATAEDDFNAITRMTRNCYGTEERSQSPSPESPVYHAVSPVYSKKVEASVKDDEKTQLSVNSGGDTPSCRPTGPIEHELQDPYGGDDTAAYSPSPSSYRPTLPSYCPTSPSYCPTSPSSSYVPQRPEGNCSSPRCNSLNGYCRITGVPIYAKPLAAASPHTLAAAKRSGLKWGA